MFCLTDLDQDFDVKALKYAKNYQSDRYLFRLLNADRPEDHSANGIIRGTDMLPVAVKCNCGRATYHPLLNPRRVDWRPEVIIFERNQNLVNADLIEKRLKKLWINEL